MTSYKYHKYHKYRRPRRLKRKKSIFRSRFFGITFLILCFLGAIFYFAFFSEIFYVKAIEISGNKKIQTQDIENFLKDRINQKILFFPTKSIFLTNFKEINRLFLEKFPQISEMNLNRKLPATLIVEIKERSPVAVWCQALPNPAEQDLGGQETNCFFIDKFGVIFEEGPENYGLVIKFLDKKEEIYLGKTIIKEEQLKPILEIQEKLKANINITTKEFIIQNDERINVKTLDGWEIYFNLKENIDWQLIKLRSVLEKEIPAEKRGELEYIDLRFGNLAPYKYR